MNNVFQQIAGEATGASEIFHNQDIKILWRGYGKIIRYGLCGADREQVVIKHVKLPDRAHHPRGWNTDLSHKPAMLQTSVVCLQELVGEFD